MITIPEWRYLMQHEHSLGTIMVPKDFIFNKFAWMPLYHLLIFRALVWYVKGLRGLAGPALQSLIHDMKNENSKAWKLSCFFSPASNILDILANSGSEPLDFSTMSIKLLKSKLKDLLYDDLSHNWRLSSFSKITHVIHSHWLPRKLPVSMHSRLSHVMYNCLAVNRAPFRSWLYKIKRAESMQCRFGCQCDETPRHVLFDCPFVNSERLKIEKRWSDENIEFNLQQLMTHPSLQM